MIDCKCTVMLVSSTFLVKPFLPQIIDFDMKMREAISKSSAEYKVNFRTELVINDAWLCPYREERVDKGL